MARAMFVKSAQKDYPEHAIKKGEVYYWWKFMRGPRHFSKTPPKPSQLTQSDFLSTVYAIQEELAELTATTHDDVQVVIDDMVSRLEDLKSETEDKFQNMPDSLQQGPTGQLLEDRVSQLDEMISELQNIDTADSAVTLDDMLSEVQAISYNGE